MKHQEKVSMWDDGWADGVPCNPDGSTRADELCRSDAEKAPESSKLKAFDVCKNKMEGRMKYYEMQHCGGLDEALKTKKPITQAEFNRRLKDYKYYCFDKRIGCHRYILKDIPNNYKKQTIWLLIECGFDS